ncbi:signal transduction histidine kinase [Roseibium hamelinense]|uniref:histidine kinase n=1 Tax=Roseibium hamelinense TaxID=150831 RepID=A0A562SXS7_9HYPH|nr:ATP-binding protein [Roseibium hamelinense]MTI43639.1 HAMP domain-containing protein [Roseibium hamelinense]TWI86157.1 signal transduction histidine kinase [Roseibium hamelinense]
MASLNHFFSNRRLPFPFSLVFSAYKAGSRWLYQVMPKGLYTRALLIIVVPILVLQSVLVIVFMERHYDLVSRRMSEAIVREIAAIVYVLENYPQEESHERIETMARDALELSVSILPLEPLPAPAPKPYFDVIDQGLSREISERIGKPFWIDTVGRSRFVEIRIQLKNEILRVFARRSQAYASNSHIFLVWMFSTSLVLIVIAMVFLRNQIRPIVRLADAAQAFGKGRPVIDFRASGAREVRRAGQAFIEMRRRIERQMDQRTTMLAGVSHDLRTILTRLKLQLTLLGETPETEGMRKDLDEMTTMLEDYLAFARGDGDEAVQFTDLGLIFEELEEEAEISGRPLKTSFEGDQEVAIRRLAIKRGLSNLVTNAAKYGSKVVLSGTNKNNWLTLVVDDNGPGIPEGQRDSATRAFQRLDSARNQDQSGSGLGLAIARDIARSHGGDLFLEDSPLGGLRARIRIPS